MSFKNIPTHLMPKLFSLENAELYIADQLNISSMQQIACSLLHSALQKGEINSVADFDYGYNKREQGVVAIEDWQLISPTEYQEGKDRNRFRCDGWIETGALGGGDYFYNVTIKRADIDAWLTSAPLHNKPASLPPQELAGETMQPSDAVDTMLHPNAAFTQSEKKNGNRSCLQTAIIDWALRQQHIPVSAGKAILNKIYTDLGFSPAAGTARKAFKSARLERISPKKMKQ